MAKSSNEFYDLGKLSEWTVRLLYIGLALTVLATVSTWFELQLLQAMRDGNFESDEAMFEAAEANDRRQLVLAIAEGAAYIVGGVFSLVWIYRSAHNARVHSTRFEYTPGSCVWWFFIPIAWLWKPYSAMTETFSEAVKQSGNSMAGDSPLLGSWWACWIISGIAYYGSLRISWNATGLNALITGDQVLLFAAAIDIPATLLFIAMIRKLGKLLAQVREIPPQPAQLST